MSLIRYWQKAIGSTVSCYRIIDFRESTKFFTFGVRFNLQFVINIGLICVTNGIDTMLR